MTTIMLLTRIHWVNNPSYQRANIFGPLSSVPLYFGGLDWGTSGDRYEGYLDEISFWNVALTGSQIQYYMTSSPSGDETGLVGYWDFNEGSGTTASDATSNGNDGTINGATWSTDVP